jgi:beta-lactamase class A
MRRSDILRLTVATGLVATLSGCTYFRTGQPTTVEGARPESLAALQARLERRITTVPGATIGIAYHDLHTGDTLYINADTSFHAASTMKVPVMIEVFRQADAGKLRTDQRVIVTNTFKSIVDGSPYTMSTTGSADSAAASRLGKEATILELVEPMIVRSSNLATNNLIEIVGATNANATARSLGARDIKVLRGVSDNKAFDAGLNNMTTARDLAVLMRAIELNTAASPASSKTMREILLRQELNSEIPAGLPPGTPVAHKTGSITGHRHDAAIVYPSRGRAYVLVILTRGMTERAVATEVMVDVSRLVYQYAMSKR